MKKAHINCVSLGIFSWVVLEPEEGRYEFEWLENIIQNLYENDIFTILATPTGAMPHWLTSKYDEESKKSTVFIDGKHTFHGKL